MCTIEIQQYGQTVQLDCPGQPGDAAETVERLVGRHLHWHEVSPPNGLIGADVDEHCQILVIK